MKILLLAVAIMMGPLGVGVAHADSGGQLFLVQPTALRAMMSARYG